MVRGGGGGGCMGGGGGVGAIKFIQNPVNLAETSTINMQICLLR